ncbi:MAG: asparaginase domain-containing protein [Vampirovibrionia bacterium]|jgi:L-asparaginase/Glu-tRNA(Gln) amidotransferase subunit D
MVLNTSTITPSSYRTIITEAKTALVTTGGTIGSTQEDEGGSIDVVKGGKEFFNREVSEALAKNSINVTNTHPAYNILSENIDPSYVIKLAETLTNVINTENPNHIVVTHGTDSMDKVVRLLTTFNDKLVEDAVHEDLKKNTELIQALEKLDKAINDTGTSIVFTGSNTIDPEEVNENIIGAFKSVYQKDQSQLDPGIYIYFHDKLIPGKHATKDIYDPNISMRYADSSSKDFKDKLNLNRENEEKIIARLRASILGSDSSKQLDQSKVMTYDVNQIRENHEGFLENLSKRPATKAILLTLYHSGTANTNLESEASTLKLIEKIRREHPNIAIFAVNENPGEPVTLDETSYEGTVNMRKAGLVPLYNIHRTVAEAKLNMLINKEPDIKADELIHKMLAPKAGTEANAELNISLINQDHIQALAAHYRF